MSYFKEFCESIHKTKAGHVPYLLDLVDQGFGDLCMAAFLADRLGHEYGGYYISSGNSIKNSVYSNYETRCQDAIDAYNQTIDDDREAKNTSHQIADKMFDPNYKYRHFTDRFNQAEIDAGFSGTGKEFC